MKTSHTKLKSSLILSLVLLSFPLWAKPVAQVTEISGQTFIITPDGKTKSLKVDDHIEDKSELMVGEGASITVNDYYDATYHLIAGSHLKFFDKSVQLKKGKTWIQSTNSRHPLALTTANAHADFFKSEFIVSFDQTSGKSQILVVNGDVEFSNVLDKNMKYSVVGGTFTFIDPEVESGLPRTPTRIGLASLNKAMAEFKTFPEKLIQDKTPSREIASVEETPAAANMSTPVKKGEIIFINAQGKVTNRFPASVSGSAHSYFKTKVKAKTTPLTSAPIRIYGASNAAQEVDMPRKPASILPKSLPATQEKVGSALNIDPEFTNSLRKEKDSQYKYSKELESLILDLKSY